MNKPVYLGQIIMNLSKTLIYEFHYNYMHPKYGCKVKLCYMDTNIYLYEIKTEYFYKDMVEEVEMRFHVSRYSKDDNRLPQTGKNKNVIFMMKDKLGGKTMTEFVALRAKMCIESYMKIGKINAAK